MKLAPLLVLLSTIHLLFAADPALVMVKHAIGGAGGYDSLSSELQWGVIIGQPYAIANTKLKHLTGDASGTDPIWVPWVSEWKSHPLQMKPPFMPNLMSHKLMVSAPIFMKIPFALFFNSSHPRRLAFN